MCSLSLFLFPQNSHARLQLPDQNSSFRERSNPRTLLPSLLQLCTICTSSPIDYFWTCPWIPNQSKISAVWEKTASPREKCWRSISSSIFSLCSLLPKYLRDQTFMETRSMFFASRTLWQIFVVRETRTPHRSWWDSPTSALRIHPLSCYQKAFSFFFFFLFFLLHLSFYLSPPSSHKSRSSPRAHALSHPTFFLSLAPWLTLKLISITRLNTQISDLFPIKNLQDV